MNVGLLGELLALPDLTSQLKVVEGRLGDVLESDTPALSEPSVRVTLSGGKRLRPILTIASAATSGRPFDAHVVAGSVAVELVQVGSLIHDDIFDAADLRRGVPTINAVEGDAVAVMAGDYVLARAGEEAASVNAEVAVTLARTITDLCLGQHLEVAEVFDLDRSLEAHYASIRGKTASLLRASCRIGALCAGLDDESVEALSRYGEAFGMSFQIIDDVLDVISTPEKLGKPVGNDIRAGVYTYPIIRALQAPDGSQLRELLVEAPNSPTSAMAAIEMIKASSVIDEALAAGDRFVAEAADALAGMERSPVVDGLAGLPAYYRDWAMTTLGP